jgi:hypothetical protein
VSIRCSYSLTWTLITTWLQCFLYIIHCKYPCIIHFCCSFTTSPSFSILKNCAFILKYKLTFLVRTQYKLQTSTNLQQILQTRCSSICFYWFTTAQQYSDYATEPLQHAHTWYVTINSAHCGFLSNTFISEWKQHIMKVGFSKSLVSKPIIIKYNANHIHHMHPNTRQGFFHKFGE